MTEVVQKDHLTGFFLREALGSFLKELIEDAEAKKKSFSIALIDLDKFKKYNDKFGHLFGDEVLKYAAGILRLTLYGDPNYYYRYGGDEFIVIFPDTEPEKAAGLLHQCIYNTFQQPFLFKKNFYKITMSYGVASYPHDGNSKDELIKKADEAMYHSKGSGTNQITLAGRLAYLKMRKWLTAFGIVCGIVLVGVISYRLIFKVVISPTIRGIKSIKIVTKPENLDRIILKDGSLYEGRIIKETEDEVTLKLYLKKGEGVITFNKSKALKIKHGSAGLFDEKEASSPSD